MSHAIAVANLAKRYRIGTGLTSLRDLLAGRVRYRPERFHAALSDVSFELDPGEALGVIGPNGAGKTTILKLLSRITSPTSGSIEVNGRSSSLIELGAGFHPDLTGRENIFLNAAILGMRRSEVRARFDEIVAFAGIERYLDTPVKRYSSGMYARLGFAVAAHVDPDVLLVDEVLAVGDYPFQMKCYGRMEYLRRQIGTALIFVSHNLDAVRRVCDRGLVLYQGRVAFLGASSDAVVAYSRAIREMARSAQSAVPDEGGLSKAVMTFDAEIVDIRMVSQSGHSSTVFTSGVDCAVIIDVAFRRAVCQPVFSLIVRTADGTVVYDTTTRWQGIVTPDFTAGEKCRVAFALRLNLLPGAYELGVDVSAAGFTHYYDQLEHALDFAVVGTEESKGVADLAAKIDVRKTLTAPEVTTA